MKTKTSQQWYDEIPKELGFVIMDPDGWDRRNYDFSFNEELITKKEFLKRVTGSTCMSSLRVMSWFAAWDK